MILGQENVMCSKQKININILHAHVTIQAAFQ